MFMQHFMQHLQNCYILCYIIYFMNTNFVSNWFETKICSCNMDFWTHWIWHFLGNFVEKFRIICRKMEAVNKLLRLLIILMCVGASDVEADTFWVASAAASTSGYFGVASRPLRFASPSLPLPLPKNLVASLPLRFRFASVSNIFNIGF